MRFLTQTIFGVFALLRAIAGALILWAAVDSALFYRSVHRDMLRAAAYVDQVLATSGALPTNDSFERWQEQEGLQYKSRVIHVSEEKAAGGSPSKYTLCHWGGEANECFRSVDHAFTTSIARYYLPIAAVGVALLWISLVALKIRKKFLPVSNEWTA